MERAYYKSPVGTLKIVCENEEIISLKIVKNINNDNDETAFIQKVKAQLDEYFDGKRKIFDIRINPKGTDFQKLVWNELKNIPYGKTKSYSYIAEKIGRSGSQRAVGSACSKNPVMIIIPCHRVISKKGNLSGYAYGADNKRYLIELEHRAI